MPTKEIINQIAMKYDTLPQEVEKELFYAVSFCENSIFKSGETLNVVDDVLKYCVQQVLEKLG